MIKDHEQVDIFIGVDVGKSNHHADAIDRKGKKPLDRALPQDEAKLCSIIKAVAGKGTVLLVVDQPSTIGALPVAVAQATTVVPGKVLVGCAVRGLHTVASAAAACVVAFAAVLASFHRSGLVSGWISIFGGLAFLGS
ncbi:IS110 family transposase, partial [Arthrobacter livingstonensis]|uniref:IS110 family transposase n=1 Tax=Arthrobacter livingstonensis TaxID=670078 RepID=UPI001B880704